MTEKPILRSIDWCGHHIGVTVFLLLVVGMGLRLAYRGMVERPERDEISYIAMVEEVAASGEEAEPGMQRALIYAGLTISRLGFDVELGLRCFNLTCSFLWLVMMYFLGKAVFSSPEAGLVCLALAACNPYMIRMGGLIMREPLYLLVFSSGLFCAIQIVRGIDIGGYAILLGVLTVLGVWSRYEGIELLILIPVAVIFRIIYILRDKLPGQWSRLVAGILLYLLSLGVSFAILYLIWPGTMKVLEQKLVSTCKRILFIR